MLWHHEVAFICEKGDLALFALYMFVKEFEKMPFLLNEMRYLVLLHENSETICIEAAFVKYEGYVKVWIKDLWIVE